jgi:DNA-directed RNA polymerase II subunit RPB1
MPVTTNAEVEPILGIQFSIFSPEEIERRSVVEITSNNTYEGNEPKIGGLFDPRMGVLENGKQCRSCGQSNNGCPGHFAHYRLGRPVYYIQFLPMILNVLSCVCVSCSKLLVDKEMRVSVRNKKGEARWKELLEVSGNISRCGQETEDGCGSRQPDRYKREGIARIVAEWDSVETKDVKHESMKQPLEVEYVQRLFRRITDEDVSFMGFNPRWCRPDWMICSVLAIPPPQVRPSVVQENNQRSEDDLTHKLFEIIKTNKMLLTKMEAEGSKANKGYIDELTNVLQYHIATLVDNQIPGVAPSAQRGGRPLKSIQQRLGSKEGRIRYNLQGKRVEFSARSVITPDPNISIAELGVPIKIAMNLTVPERVTEFNRDKIYKLVQNGSTTYPGAKTLVRKDGRMISLAHVNTKEIVLYNGDMVNRHLMDGDMVLFNRQPTLHRMSMMGHRVRVLPGNTFRLNVSVTSPYNADFDGDEMNAHIPQSSEAIQELKDIAAVPYQMISPRHQKPVIKVVQDALLGSHRITKQGDVFTRREYMNLMMWNKRFDGTLPEPEIIDGSPRWTGQQVLSSLFPPMNMDLKNKYYDDDPSPENMVKIRNGVIQPGGIVDDDVLNKTGVGVVHTTYNDFGAFAAVDLLDSVQSTIEAYLVMSGFSIGLSDLVADDKTLTTMNDIVQQRKKEIDEIVLQVHMDLFDNSTGKSNQDEFESQVFGKLNKAIEELGKLGQQALAPQNRLISMLKAGSKGSTINVSQMVACVGQQNIEGRRIPYGFTDRTLPHYKKFDDGAEARGFVENSFVKGLTPQEFFFHAMSGREGLIDTAVKTAETGYIQRQMVKAMEDLVTQHDGTVRDARNNIVQFHYGEDGLSCTKVETQSLPIHGMSEEDIRNLVGLQGVDWSAVLSVERKENVEAINDLVEKILQDRAMLVNDIFRNGRPKGLMGPMNLDRMILNLKVKFALDANAKTDLTPEYVMDRLRDLQARTLPFHKMWAAMLRFHLGPHNSVVKHRMTQIAFNTLMEQILMKNWASWAQPGEQVGIIAAQSIGEPATQMTLNSVDWDTRILIAKDGKIWSPEIGDFIDSYYTACEDKSRIQSLPNSQIYIDLKDGHDWKAVSCNEYGEMVWTRLEAITRHPVINEDGTDTILEVTLASGRVVKGTKAKSFLTLVNGKIEPVNGSDLKVGDCLPIGNNLSVESLGLLHTLELRTILPANRYLYGSEVVKALAALNSGDRHWFQKNNGSAFTVPYLRSDIFRDAFVNGRNTNGETIKAGFVYPKRTRPDVSQIPESIPLDDDFGFFVGAYLAEGMSNSTQVNITNNDLGFLEKVQGLMRRWNVGTHLVAEDRHCAKTGIEGRTTSLVIHSTILSQLMQKVFGRVSYEKKLPDWVLQAPDVFVKALVDAYICGDGTVAKRDGCILACSVSKDLLVKFSTLLTRYGIFSSLSSRMPEKGQFTSVSRAYTLSIPVKYSHIFSETFTLSMARKQSLLDTNFTETKESRCRRTTLNEVVWDSIQAIKEVRPIHGWVYDLTVETTRNFMTLDSVCLRDTFHLAGVAAKSGMTRGVPRLKELFKATKSPKATSLSIFLKPEFRDDKEKAREVVQDLELTMLRDIVRTVGLYYDPKEADTVVPEDRDLLAFYKLFEQRQLTEGADAAENMEAEAEAPGAGGVKPFSLWMLRLEFNRDAMFNRNITMDDVAFVLNEKLSDTISMVYSDFNSERLVMRIRLAPDPQAGPDDYVNFKKLQARLLTTIVIRGVPGIKAASFSKSETRIEIVDGKPQKIPEYSIDTDGSNFIEVMNHPAIDPTRLYTTNVHDVLDVLGIEAARNILLTEIESLFADAGVNYRHLGLLIDSMTRNGRLMSVDRYGINKNNIGPLAKASFEETEKILLRAALFGEIDPVTGVSAKIMTGQPIRGGTTFSHLLLDEMALLRLQKGLPPVKDVEEEDVDEIDEEDAAEELAVARDDKCNTVRLRMNAVMPDGDVTLEEPDVEFNLLE